MITGTGRAFSTGADIAGFQAHLKAGPQQAVAHFMRPGHQMTRRVETFPKPIVAGYGQRSVPEPYRGTPTLGKPFDADALEQAIKAVL